MKYIRLVQEEKVRPYNCPNCNAPITDYKCEYCGTVFDLEKSEERKAGFGISFEDCANRVVAFQKLLRGE